MRAAIKPTHFLEGEDGVREPWPFADAAGGLWPVPPDVEPPDPASDAGLRRRRDIARMKPGEREAALAALELGNAIGNLLAYLKARLSAWLRGPTPAPRSNVSRPPSINVLRIRRARLYRREHAASARTGVTGQ